MLNQDKINALRETLKHGIQTVAVPQLFETPRELAARMVDEASIEPGNSVLEPSAGTGRILQAIMTDDTARAVIAVEINQQLADRLREEYPLTDVFDWDFLQYQRGNYPVDRIIMNPPFINGADIKHIKHALTMLKSGGRLVAICANGPRQRDQLMPIAENSGGFWEGLPQGTFKDKGTNVNTALIVIEG